MRLSIKLSLFATSVLIFAVALITFLNYTKYRNLSDEIERGRYEVLLQEMRGTLERGLALGLHLDQIRNTEPIMARLRSAYPAIDAIQVVDSNGAVIYAAGDLAAATAVSARLAELANSQGRSAIEPIHLAGQPGLVAPLTNSFGKTVGAIVLAYQAVGALEAGEGLGLWPIELAVLVTLFGAAAIFVGVALLSRGLSRTFLRLCALTEGLGRTEDAAAAEQVLVPAADGVSEELLDADLVSRFNRTRQQAERLERDIERCRAILPS